MVGHLSQNRSAVRTFLSPCTSSANCRFSLDSFRKCLFSRGFRRSRSCLSTSWTHATRERFQIRRGWPRKASAANQKTGERRRETATSFAWCRGKGLPLNALHRAKKVVRQGRRKRVKAAITLRATLNHPLCLRQLSGNFSGMATGEFQSLQNRAVVAKRYTVAISVDGTSGRLRSRIDGLAWGAAVENRSG